MSQLIILFYLWLFICAAAAFDDEDTELEADVHPDDGNDENHQKNIQVPDLIETHVPGFWFQKLCTTIPRIKVVVVKQKVTWAYANSIDGLVFIYVSLSVTLN